MKVLVRGVSLVGATVVLAVVLAACGGSSGSSSGGGGSSSGGTLKPALDGSGQSLTGGKRVGRCLNGRSNDAGIDRGNQS